MNHAVALFLQMTQGYARVGYTVTISRKASDGSCLKEKALSVGFDSLAHSFVLPRRCYHYFLWGETVGGRAELPTNQHVRL